jgi:predicted PurR-regulated permease PerM
MAKNIKKGSLVMENIALSKSRIAFLFVLAGIISVLFLRLIWSFLVPLLMAAVLAGMAHPFYYRFLDLTRDRKAIAAGVTVSLCLLLIIIPLLLFLGILVNEAIAITESARDWVTRQEQQPESFQQKIQEHQSLKRLLPYQDKILEKAGQLAARAGTFVAGGLATGAKGTAEFILMLFVTLYATFYFLQDGRAVLHWLFDYTPLATGDKERLVATFSSVARATLKGKLVIGLVQGGLAGVAFAVAGIEGAVFWGAMTAIASLIPLVGTGLVWIPAVVYLVMVGKTGVAVGVAVWCAIVVGLVDNFLGPVLVGRETKMPDLMVLLTTLGGLALFGAAGIVVGPIVGALFITVWDLWSSAVEEAIPVPK